MRGQLESKSNESEVSLNDFEVEGVVGEGGVEKCIRCEMGWDDDEGS